MSLWVDKYRAKTLSQLSYHENVTQNLKALSKSGDFPHLLVYGPSGSGKKTRIYCTLQEIFGTSVEKLKIDVKNFVTSSNRKLEFNVLSSPHHLEITPSDMGNNDRVVIQDLLKDVASTEQVDFGNQSSRRHRFKVVIINEADSLSRDAQAALRRTMEKYSSNIRLILVCNSISNIIAPIKSRTLLVRIPSPTVNDISSILNQISNREQVKFSSSSQQDINQFYNQIATVSNRNLRRSLLAFETIYMQNETIDVKKIHNVIVLDWETIINNMAKTIISNRNVPTLAKLRSTNYELLSHCIPAKIILKTLLFELIKLCKSNVNLIQEIVKIASLFDERLSLGQKSIFHLEGFIAKSMVAIDQFI
ncbi:RFC5 [Candida pseudojiufengensis]|uniref:RFC5 n=1 Tax=Candida pseudojiufengensis TaxID=497109 RepID=UPI002224F42A|nr:RFC5 [Candida pseudojiufengensis]KAI5964634.1 RFC5 [Candida pseudojiufengensis]